MTIGMEIGMGRLDRYLMRHIFSLTAIVGFGLIAIFTFVLFVSEIGETQGNFGIPQLALYVILLMPSSLYTLMPLIALLGTLLGIGALARQGELTAMRAAGISAMRIGSATAMAGIVSGLFTFAIGNWLAPIGARAADALRATGRGDVMSQAIWTRDSHDIFSINRLDSENQIGELTVFELTADQRIGRTFTAASGHYDRDHWIFNDIRETDFQPDGTTRTHIAPSMEWRGGLSPNVLRLFVLEADSLSVRGLHLLIAYLRDNHLDTAKYQLLLWRRLVEPLTVIAMMVFAVPFVLGRMRDTGAGQRLLLGMLVGVVFYVLNKISAGYGSLYDLPAPLTASGPTLLFGLLALGRLWRAR